MRLPDVKTWAQGAAQKGSSAEAPKAPAGGSNGDLQEGEEGEEESWVAEKVEDAKETVAAIISAVPGPRVGNSGAPWLLVVPVAYLGLTLIIAVVKTIRKFNSPRAQRRRQVNKNASLIESLDQLLEAPQGGPAPVVTPADYKDQERKFGFDGAEILRKYLRYALNEKPFGPPVVLSLISLRKASGLTDEEMAEVLNEVSRRTVKAKGPVVMDTAGFTEKGLQRKAAVQALFSKLLYLSEVEDFCSQSVKDKVEIKVIFGVTDEDAESIRITSLTSAEDMEKLDQGLDPSGGSLSSREDE